MNKHGSKVDFRNINVAYGNKQVIFDINLSVRANSVMAFIGPSGCGKSTLLRCVNRMNDVIDHCRISGEIYIDDFNIYSNSTEVHDLRANVGMVFQKPNPFPKSIYENVAYGPRIHGIGHSKADIDVVVEKSLIRVGLFDEVKDRLNQSANGLSGGQQQRLCIARAIAVEPEIILMDEPCSALDPRATKKIEYLIAELREKFTIIIVTHSMQQAARVSKDTAFFNLGKLVEVGTTDQIFSNPKESKTKEYITGQIG